MEKKEKIGVYLKRIRISRKLSLRDVGSQIHIKQSYLEAIEEGNYHELRSEVYIRGFLRSYARFLGVPADFAIERYENEGKGTASDDRENRRRGGKLRREKDRGSEKNKRSSKSIGWLVGMIAVLLVIAFGIWKGPQWSRTFSFSRSEMGSIRVETLAEESAWVQVWIDGELAGEGFFSKNKQHEWVGRDEIQVIAGDGSAILVKVNGVDRGRLGTKKEKVHQVFRSP